MLHPSKIIDRKKRAVLWTIARLIHLKPDTFVFVCRDMGLDVGEIAYLVEYYFRLDSSLAKRISFGSAAWADVNPSLVESSNAAFDFFEKESHEGNRQGR